MGNERYASLARLVFITCLSIILSACSSGSSSGSSDGLVSNFVVSGSVGDGPIVGADITVLDAFGNIIARGVSDERANYQVDIPGGSHLPVSVHVIGGTDLVTQRPADFQLLSLITEVGEQTVNVSPLTTLVARAAQCANDLSETKIDQLWQAVDRDLNIGLDSAVFGHPLRDPVTADNVETAVLANEALGEWIRRAGSSLLTSDVSLEQIVQTVACDLGDGAMDGVTVNSPPLAPSVEVQQRILAVAKAVEAGVRLEVLAGRLEVDGSDASSAMNAAVSTVMPELTAPDVNRVPVTEQALQKAIEALTILTGVINDSELTDLVTALENTTPEAAADLITAALDANVHITLQGLPTRIGLADNTEITAINDRTEQQNETNRPIVALGAEPDNVSNGGTTVLSWASSNADRCISDWGGELGREGTWTSGALQTSTRYELTCFGLGGGTSAYIDVTVDDQPVTQPDPQNPAQPDPQTPAQPDPQTPNQPQPEAGLPVVELSSNTAVVASGGNVELSWATQDADSCTASGGWSGNKSTAGNETVGPVTTSQNYTLTCSNADGSAANMVNVVVNGQIQLNWRAPTENVDGSAVAGLSAYKIFYGTNSRQYEAPIELAGNLTSYTLDLPVGSYFLAMSTVDQAGIESGLTPEVRLQAQ